VTGGGVRSQAGRRGAARPGGAPALLGLVSEARRLWPCPSSSGPPVPCPRQPDGDERPRAPAAMVRSSCESWPPTRVGAPTVAPVASLSLGKRALCDRRHLHLDEHHSQRAGGCGVEVVAGSGGAAGGAMAWPAAACTSGATATSLRRRGRGRRRIARWCGPRRRRGLDGPRAGPEYCRLAGGRRSRRDGTRSSCGGSGVRPASRPRAPLGVSWARVSRWRASLEASSGPGVVINTTSIIKWVSGLRAPPGCGCCGWCCWWGGLVFGDVGGGVTGLGVGCHRRPPWGVVLHVT